jgi:hypothetical protein
VLGVILLLVLIIELVRRQKLRTGYSLLWLFTGLLALILVVFHDVLIILGQLMGITSARSLLFTAGIVFALLILLEHSLTLTILWRQNKSQAQEQALLEWQIRQLRARLEGASPHSLADAEPTSKPTPEREDS